MISGFSFKRATGITKNKRNISKITGIPTSKSGRKQKRNSLIAKMLGLK